MHMNSEKLIDLDELAAMLRIPKRSAYLLFFNRKIPAIKVNAKTLRFEPSEVLRALKKQGGRHSKRTAS
jgi:hypothetical protein